ncbi:NINE protein [Campylobacter gastrosuis]|uniref:NINE protein n=1 Tax=Campylobacter gastrosuis TaxID=2974576 RepID=A0ABT7HRQ2_9BACT|nr:NINE protein [Campylobacter gastrosuis]MDL0089535.1 NINE protein [Campylobacter gastrosuis]
MNNVYIAYGLWFFLGWLGAHRLYLGKFISGFLMMGLWFLGSATFVFLVGWFFWAIWGIWWIIDVFLVGKIVDENLQKTKLKDELKIRDKADDLRELYELFERGEISKAELEARKEILFRS